MDNNSTSQDTAQGAVQNIKIAGMIFPIPKPYAAGHTLDELEAKALNQLFAENVRNNCSKMVKDAAPADGQALSVEETSALRTKLMAYAESYHFSARAPKEPQDPAVALARKLAAEEYRAALRAKGRDPKEISKEDFEKNISWIVENRPRFLEEAQRRLDVAQAGANDLLSELVGA